MNNEKGKFYVLSVQVSQRIKLQTETFPYDELKAMPRKYSLSLNEQCFNHFIRGFHLLTKRFFPSYKWS